MMRRSRRALPMQRGARHSTIAPDAVDVYRIDHPVYPFHLHHRHPEATILHIVSASRQSSTLLAAPLDTANPLHNSTRHTKVSASASNRRHHRRRPHASTMEPPPCPRCPLSPSTPPSQPRLREYVHSCCGRGGEAAPSCSPTVAPPLSRSTGVGPVAPSPSTSPPTAAPATRPPPVHPTRPIGGRHLASAAPPGTTRPREHLTAAPAAAPSQDTLHRSSLRPPHPPCPAAPRPSAPPQTTRLTLEAAPSSATPPSPPARRRRSAPHPSPA